VTPQLLEEFNCSLSDTEYIIDTLKTLEEPKVCFLFKVVNGGLVKASVRSRNDFDSTRIAEVFGGGGHFAAAGFRFRGTLDEVIAAVEEAMHKLRRDPREREAG
jgi:phosphoesterase RecJ-like protein